MKDNATIYLKGETAILVPYEKEHVPKYHSWMQRPELQELTSSEPLTLEQEYEMQQSWRDDDHKCTFIVLDRSVPDDDHGWAMAGDVNIFWLEQEGDHIAEIEVMIAEEASRRKGLAQESLQLMMAYAVSHLRAQGFMAKVKDTNEPSISLFQKLGFVSEKKVPVFSEEHFRLDASIAPEAWLAVTERAAAVILHPLEELQAQLTGGGSG